MQPVAASLPCGGSPLQNEVRTLGQSPEDHSEVLDPAIPEAMGLSVTEQISFKLSQLELGFCHLHGKEC